MKRSVNVEIAGQSLTIKSDEGPQYVQQLADYVDDKIREIGGGRASYNLQRVALLVAIQLADELLREKEDRQQALDLEELYGMQRCTTQRFALVSACFGLVGSVKDQAMTVDLIKRLLFQQDELRRNKVLIDRNLRSFQSSLRDYMLKDSSATNDETVRQSWGAIEELLRGLGREI